MATTMMTADRFVEILRAEGLTVVEYPGWRDHNRNHKGAWGPLYGVLLHHTVTGPKVNGVKLCHDGYVGLPGPLCQGVIRRNGEVHLVGWGRANHAGGGDRDVLAAVKDQKALPKTNEGNSDGVDGNRHFVGFECENDGVGERWPAEQVEAMVKASAAVVRELERDQRSVLGHLEWSDDKSDPRGPGFPGMPAMRTRVKARLAADDTPPAEGGGGKPPTTKPTHHVVKAGENLSTIAKKYPPFTWEDFARQNNIKSPYRITPGQRLQIPSSTKPPAKPVVSLRHIQAAHDRDPGAKQGATTYAAEVKIVERALAVRGFLSAQWVDGSFGSKTVDAYKAFQISRGYRGTAADGRPGLDSLSWLGARHGFTVTP